MKKNICIFKNITGRTYTNADMTNTDMSDTIVNATCQYYSGNINLDMSDNRLIFFLHIKKIQTMSTVAIAYKLVLIISATRCQK